MNTALVLAAGAGTRLGLPKALAIVAGRTALERVISACTDSLVDEVIVVTGARGEEVEHLMARTAPAAGAAPVRSIRNEDWARGRTGSVQAGWRAAAAGSHALVFPVDHPAVRGTTLDLLLGVFGYAAASPDVVVPVVGESGRRRRGHPVVLAAGLRDAVLALGPDQPLHELVHASQVLEVPVDDEGILLDVNTPDDLRRAADLVRSRERS